MSGESGAGMKRCVECDAPASQSVGGLDFCSEAHQRAYFNMRSVWDTAKTEYELYKRYDRPTGPYYMKCLCCGDVFEFDDLHNADNDCRYHAGYHGGLKREDAEIVVTDSCGRELWRQHALHRGQDDANTCDSCGAPLESRNRVSCPDCGTIPEEARL